MSRAEHIAVRLFALPFLIFLSAGALITSALSWTGKRRKGTPRVWRMPRLWIADQHSVRLSLPWHGPASWDDMHEYVTKVFTDNTVPNASRVGYGTDEEQAATFARGILLSLCHRLNIEPVGAFDYHDPDYREEDQ
jgi:hypothetical protein